MMIGSSFFFVKYILNMKSENAFDYLCAGLCHVSDGELLDGHRVGCADLVYYDSAVSAIEQAERDVEERMRRKAISAFGDMWFENGEDGAFEPDYEYHRKNFIARING